MLSMGYFLVEKFGNLVDVNVCLKCVDEVLKLGNVKFGYINLFVLDDEICDIVE